MRKLIDCESIKTIVDITKNKTISNLEDGLYAIDRKDGWVREKDAGFLRSIIIPSGAQGGLQEISCVESTTTTVKQSTTIFKIEYNFGTKVNQNQLYEKTDRNILGDSDYATTSFILQQNSVGIYF